MEEFNNKNKQQPRDPQWEAGGRDFPRSDLGPNNGPFLIK